MRSDCARRKLLEIRLLLQQDLLVSSGQFPFLWERNTGQEAHRISGRWQLLARAQLAPVRWWGLWSVLAFKPALQEISDLLCVSSRSVLCPRREALCDCPLPLEKDG